MSNCFVDAPWRHPGGTNIQAAQAPASPALADIESVVVTCQALLSLARCAMSDLTPQTPKPTPPTAHYPTPGPAPYPAPAPAPTPAPASVPTPVLEPAPVPDPMQTFAGAAAKSDLFKRRRLADEQAAMEQQQAMTKTRLETPMHAPKRIPAKQKAPVPMRIEPFFPSKALEHVPKQPDTPLSARAPLEHVPKQPKQPDTPPPAHLQDPIDQAALSKQPKQPDTPPPAHLQDPIDQAALSKQPKQPDAPPPAHSQDPIDQAAKKASRQPMSPVGPPPMASRAMPIQPPPVPEQPIKAPLRPKPPIHPPPEHLRRKPSTV